MAGATSSADFPVTISGSGYQGNRDGFVVKSIVPTNSCSDQKDECADATLKGDVNGDGEITPQDAADAFELSFKSSWTGDELCRADYNGDGEITPQDAADIFEASL
jgi:hypothetical protein